MFRAFSRPSSGAQWLQWQVLVLPSYRGDSRAVFVVGPAVRQNLLLLSLLTERQTQRNLKTAVGISLQKQLRYLVGTISNTRPEVFWCCCLVTESYEFSWLYVLRSLTIWLHGAELRGILEKLTWRQVVAKFMAFDEIHYRFHKFPPLAWASSRPPTLFV
jgi:hypothetical protein